MNYWLMKSEPSVFSIDDLRKVRTTGWDGVRNYQARNMMRDQMRKGDLAFFYHSNCDELGVVGIMEIAGPARPDPTAFDPDDDHYDPRSDPEKPRWYLVDVRFKRKLRRPVTLAEMRQERALGKMQLLKRGNRLSITPVTKKEWEHILSMEKRSTG